MQRKRKVVIQAATVRYVSSVIQVTEAKKEKENKLNNSLSRCNNVSTCFARIRHASEDN